MKYLTGLRSLALAGAASLWMWSGSAKAAQTQQAPLPEAEVSIEYQSASEALKALRAKPGVVFTTENGWLIATDEGVDVLCEASKAACDDLVCTFAKMNGLPLPQ